MNRAVFFDRDGVINYEKNYLIKEKEIAIPSGVKKTLKTLKEKGFFILVVSNQPAVAKGMAKEEDIDLINKKINLRLEGLIDRFYFCPHHPHANLKKYRKICECRKPNPGMLIQGIKNFNLDVGKCWMVGDRISDIVAGSRAGCKTILLKTQYSQQKIEGFYPNKEIAPEYIVDKITQILKIIK